MSGSANAKELDKVQQSIHLVKIIRTTMIGLQKKLSNTTLPDPNDEQACKKFQLSIDTQTKSVEKWFNKLEDYFRDMPERIDKLPVFTTEVMKRLQSLLADTNMDVHVVSPFEDFISSANWNESVQNYFYYSGEFMKMPVRRRICTMEKKQQIISQWDSVSSPHSSFEKSLRQVQADLSTKKVGMWPTILERSAFGCIFEIKYGLIVDRQPVVQQKMLVVENSGLIEMVRFVAPHEEWYFFDDFGSRRVDLTMQSRYIVYQKLTTQANIQLQVVMSAVNIDHKWTPSQITSLLHMFSRYQQVFETPCKTCGKVMKDFLPPFFDPRSPRSTATHETCRG
ncbi:unnamed protein product [Auanema sp. JU1783]|nr:unnamed protein product [Auanema sp. JU1783]